MTKVLVVGCGDLGGEVAIQLASLGFETVGLRRNVSKIDGVAMLQADVTKSGTLTELAQIQPEVIIYSVAANGQTDEQYKLHYVDGLRNILATQSNNTHLKHVFFISSTRVYGQKTDEILDEATPAIPADFGGERLLEAEQLLKSLPCHHSVLRLSGIYGAGCLRMIRLAQSPNSWPAENSWTNRIHRDDAAAFIVFLVQQINAGKVIQPCYIVTDSKPVSQYEVLNWIADQLNVVDRPDVASDVISGKRLSNRAMLATGFQLQYPDYQAGYLSLIKS